MGLFGGGSTYNPDNKLVGGTRAQASAYSEAPFQRNLSKYLTQGGSVEDAIAAYQKELEHTKLRRGDENTGPQFKNGQWVMGDGKPIYGRDEQADAKMQAFRNALATDALTGSRVATEEVQKNPLLANLFGEQGLNNRLNTEEQQLAGQGYQLTPEDRTAYGQASGDISRQFGQQQSDLTQSLARRGLASGASGAAGAAFSGLAGNQNEMLAKAQTDIADRRMQNTMQRLNQTRQLMSQLGSQANTSINDQFNRQTGGARAAEQAQTGYGGFSEGLANQQTTSANANQGTSLGQALVAGGLAGATGGTSALFGAGASALGGSLFGGAGGGSGSSGYSSGYPSPGSSTALSSNGWSFK